MKYIALLRGINVGNSNRVDMKQLKQMFEDAGYTDVSTYINSGNILFHSSDDLTAIRDEIRSGLYKNFRLNVPVLVKTSADIKRIVKKVPAGWVNDDTQRTDVAFLFEEIDTDTIIDQLPLKREFIDVRYTEGALFWNVSRENYNKSQLNKLISNKLYQYMTVRNINTARYLAEKS